IQEEIFATVKKLRESGEQVVFLDAPTLIESGTDAYCDKVVSVTAPAEDRFVRIVRRDNLTAEEAGRRMDAQHDDEFYASRSDFVIRNDGSMTDLRLRVMEMLNAVGVVLPGDGGSL
ncbi:MAG: dephospho-CoA kinase, partial [Oscillospiraceae bacterium]|nr:dephospho-CoA kinase [Oscillospiraceae bacterium]